MIITNKGLKTQSFLEIKEKLQQRFRVAFGEDIALEDHTVEGQIVNLLADQLANDDKNIVSTYKAHSIDHAQGELLDNVAQFYNIKRKLASYCSVDLLVHFSEPTELTDKKLLHKRSGREFLIISQSPDLLNLQARSVKSGHLEVLEQDEFTLLTYNSKVHSLKALTRSFAEDAEQDIPFRARLKKSFSINGQSSKETMLSAVLAIQGVKQALIIDYNIDQTIPLGVVRCVVYADQAVYQPVAKAIFSKLPVGIQTQGAIEEVLKDAQGFDHTIYFDVPILSSIALKCQIKPKAGVFLGEDAPSIIKQNLLEFFENMKVGENVVYSQLFNPINAAGEFSVESLQIKEDSGEWQTGNLLISADTIATTSGDLLHVEIVG